MRLAIRQIWALLRKDLLIDLRRKENLLAMVFFAVLTLMIFQFALGDRGDDLFRVTPRVVAELEARGLPRDDLAALALLMGRTYSTPSGFLGAFDLARQRPGGGGERIAILEASRRTFLEESAAGLLWVTFLLAGILGLSKSFAQERENACLEGLLLTPVDRGMLYLGKMIGNALFLLILLLLLLPMFALMFGIHLGAVWLPLGVVILAGVVGFSALGTLLGAITASLRGREVLLPLLLFPLMVPVLIMEVQITGAILDGEPLAGQARWLGLLGLFDALYLTVSYLVFEYVMET